MLKVVQVLAKYGFENFIAGSKLEAHLAKIRSESKIPPDLSTHERVRMALEELGTTYIKLGQILSQQTHPATISLICSFCPSDRDIAASFLQIPPHGGHPCL